MTTQPATEFTNISAAARNALAAGDPGWQPVTTQIVTIVQGVMPDGTVGYRHLFPFGQSPEATAAVVHGFAKQLPLPELWAGGES